MQSSDPGHLFQTTTQIKQAAEREKKFKAAEQIGNPINVSSKVLDLVVRGQEGWTGESGFLSRRLDLRSGKTIKLYKSHSGPVTSVALHEIKNEDGTKWLALFTGSWDKTIKIWNADSGELLFTLEGHTDFLKSLLILPLSSPLLLSTSSDRTIRIWDLSSLSTSTKTSPRSIQNIKEHTRPVECSILKLHLDGNGRSTGGMDVWTGDSLGLIKKWEINESERKLKWKEDILGHDTSVSQLALTDDGLWSVSMDKSAIFHPFVPSSSSSSSSPKPTITHPSYVKSVLPIPEEFELPRSLLLTGSEDEHIRIFDHESILDITSTSDANAGKLYGMIQGHCGEVSVLRVWWSDGNGIESGWYVISGGLDSTLRRWGVKDILNPPVLNYEPEEVKESSGMTEEEERELAELMSDED
ncbi:uncharacterized protein IL334_000680 [Kwoniella shivajii]|uniref:Cytoplasmic protein n=1 Tax=Kwoniella shivajii TaxID=564305 RepID=A0ABZ1CRC1_9TREE|nr:hypothetical protein IL334_000680 [Kwoniella shivajii]